jgi:hypothetical protein
MDHQHTQFRRRSKTYRFQEKYQPRNGNFEINDNATDGISLIQTAATKAAGTKGNKLGQHRSRSVVYLIDTVTGIFEKYQILDIE